MGNCGHKVPCGCGDQPLMTPPSCDNAGACAGETCAELFCEECIVHCQPEMEYTINGNVFNIPQGARLDEVIQRILVMMGNPTCLDTIAYGLKVIAKTTSTITLKWVADPALIFDITYQEGANLSTDGPISGVNTYQIRNLIPGTEYSIKLITQVSLCESVTLKVTTNSIS